MDIDKLYLATYNYNVKDGNLVEVEDEDKKLQNELLDNYLALLKDAGKQIKGEWTMGKYMQILHRPVDKDTQLVEDVLHTIEANVNQRVEEPMMFGSLSTQVDIRDAFLTGKRDIAPYALSNSNHILTLLYGVGFNPQKAGILRYLGRTSFGVYKDRDGKSIMSWLSALINAHVDVAKDPYILRLNVNSFTNNMLELLVRTGFGKDAFYFIKQPIFEKLAIEYQNANGTIVEDPGLSPTERSREAIRKYMMSMDFGAENNDTVEMLTNRRTNKKDIELFHLDHMYIYQALFGVDNDGNYSDKLTLLEKLLTDKSYRIDPNKPASIDNLKKEEIISIKRVVDTEDGDKKSEEVKFSPYVLQMYAFFAWQQLDVYAQALSNLVQYTRIDNKKQGINYQELLDYAQHYDELVDMSKDRDGLFNGGLNQMLMLSFINKKTANALGVLPRILGNEMIHYTYHFLSLVYRICNEKLNNRTNDTKRAVKRALYSYIKQRCMNECMRRHNVNWFDMISGDNTLASRIIALQRKMMLDNEDKYSDFVVNGVMTNNLLANLQRVYYTAPYGYEQFDLVTLDNSQADDVEIKDGYIDDWLLMWESEDEEIHNIAFNLAVYAFMTSADNSGFTKFFKYCPLDIREAIGYTEELAKMRDQFMDPLYDPFEDIDIDDVIRNNWKNNNILPVYDLWRTTKTGARKQQVIGSYITYNEVNESGEAVEHRDVYKVFAPISYYNGTWYVNIKQSRMGEFPPYVKTIRPKTNRLSADNYLLYKLIGVGTKQVITKNRTTSVEYPIYALWAPKGYDIRVGLQVFNFYENERNDGYKHLFDSEYVFSEEYQASAEAASRNIRAFINDDTYKLDDESLTDYMKFVYSDEGDVIHLFMEDIYRSNRFNIPMDDQLYTSYEDTSDVPFTYSKNLPEPVWTRATSNYNRQQVQNDPNTLYIFTDNTDRTSGGQLYGDGWYKEKYGEGGFGSTNNPTTAQIRGLDNAAPISTMKYFYRLHKGMSVADARWTDADIEEFKKTIDSEIEDIKKLWDSGKFKRVVYPGGDGFFNSRIAQISRDSEIGKYLDSKLLELENYINAVQAPLFITPAKSVDKKASAKGSISNKFIGFADGIQGSSTAEYARLAGDKANSGVYSPEDVVFVSIPGLRGDADIRHAQQDRTIEEALKALDAGATLITDNKDYTLNSQYNEGEKKLAKALEEAGAKYSERVVNGETLGVWNKSNDESKVNNNLPGPETKINIYAGTGENADLSNLADRPFTFQGYNFKSVEQAFLYAKLQGLKLQLIFAGSNSSKRTAEKVDELMRRIMESDSGSLARAIGKTKVNSRSIDTKDTIDFYFNSIWEKRSVIAMKMLLKYSFEQNPQALQRLLATGNATLTHTQDKGKWGTEFPRLLMEVRDELRAENNQLNDQSNEFNNSSEFPTDEMNHCKH